MDLCIFQLAAIIGFRKTQPPWNYGFNADHADFYDNERLTLLVVFIQAMLTLLFIKLTPT